MSQKFQLSCPIPKVDFDVINLGHGSGGLLTNKLLDQIIFEVLGNDKLDTRHDGALFSISGQIAMSTDSFVISPIFFPGGNIGSLSIHGTVNDLAMCGARPLYLSLSFIIEEGLPLEELWEILHTIKQAADDAGVAIVTGDTKVVERGKGDKIFINTTGIGEVLPSANINLARIKPTDQIIVSDSIATHGMAIMSVREGLEFETTIESDSRSLATMANDLVDHFGENIHVLRDPTRGGVGTVLAEIGRDTNLGMNLDQKKIPILPEVMGACEILGLDPLYVANEGVFIAIVDQSIADNCVNILRKHPEGKHAAIIGEVVSDHPRQVVLTSLIGGKRMVNMLVGEQLPRIC